MTTTDNIFQVYYDKLYSHKDYAAEVGIISELAENTLGKSPDSIMDVGCGTGGHSLIFAQKGYAVVGADIDRYSIDIARRKAAGLQLKNLDFICKEIDMIDRYGFDLIVSMFNVINFFQTEESLLDFFKSIYERLASPGMYLFDCWNGIAALADLPHEKNSTIICDEEKIEIKTSPKVALVDQTVLVENTVTVTDKDGQRIDFDFKYEHKLWKPLILADLLMSSGFETPIIYEWMKPGLIATDNSWKIMFVCKKA